MFIQNVYPLFYLLFKNNNIIRYVIFLCVHFPCSFLFMLQSSRGQHYIFSSLPTVKKTNRGCGNPNIAAALCAQG